MANSARSSGGKAPQQQQSSQDKEKHEVEEKALKKEFESLCTFLKTGSDAHDLTQRWQRTLREKPYLVKMVDREGKTPLLQAIIAEAPAEKVNLMIGIDAGLAKIVFKGRLPLHVALEKNPQIQILDSLIDAYPDAVKEKDADGILPLHIVLHSNPFPSSFGELAKTVAKLYPEATHTAVHDLLPLHIVLQRSLAVSVVDTIIRVNRSAAAVLTKEGRFPLHIAIEKSFQISIIDALVDAFPPALIANIPMPGDDLLPLLYATRFGGNPQMRYLLMTGGEGVSSMNPRVNCYARAVSVGAVTVNPRILSPQELENREKANTNRTVQKQKQTHEMRCTKFVRFTVQPYSGSGFHVEMGLVDTVVMLKNHISVQQGTPTDMQRLTIDDAQMMDDFSLYSYSISRDSIVRMSIRYDLLNLSLANRKNHDDDLLTLQILRLRPQSAKEDNQNGKPPLLTALQQEAGKDVIKALLLQNPRAANKEVVGGLIGEFPLHLALQKHYEFGVIRLLLQDATEDAWSSTGAYIPSGTESSAEKDRCQPPLHLALEVGCEMDTLKLLIHSKCPVFCRHQGQSPLEKLLTSPASLYDEQFHFILLRMAAELAGLLPEFFEGHLLGVFHRLRARVKQPEVSHGQLSSLQPGELVHCEEFSDKLLADGVGRSLMVAGENGQVPLHLAVQVDTPLSIVEEICRLSPESLSIYDMDGRLPMHVAIAHKMSFTIVRCLVTKFPGSVHLHDGKNLNSVQIAVTTPGVPPGVIQELARNDNSVLQVRDSRGMTLVELATSANAPSWVIEEVVSLMADDLGDMNLFSSRIGSSRAAATAFHVSGRFKLATGAKCDAAQMLMRKRTDSQMRLQSGKASEEEPVEEQPSVLDSLWPLNLRPSKVSEEVLAEVEEEESSVLGSLFSWFGGSGDASTARI